MDQTEQRLREIVHLLQDETEDWVVKIVELGVRLSNYPGADGQVFHRLVSWEELRLSRNNPLIDAKARIERHWRGPKDE